MSKAIEVDAVWKKYVLGRAAHGTLRDALTSAAARARSRNVPKRDTIWALRDVSFDVDQGELLAIIGRNGAGKSTMLKILSRITLPTKGRAAIRGRVGSLLEVGTGFHPELTGRENVMMNGAILGMSRDEITGKLDRIIEFAGLGGFIDTPVKRYSSGMHMRLAFSVAAHLEPEVMLVDEVLAVGYIEFQKKCLGRISEMRELGRTVVFISHNMAAVQRICPRSVLLDNGGLVADGPTQEVIETYYRLTSPEGDVSPQSPQGPVDKPRFLSWSLDADAAVGAFSMKSGSACTLTFDLELPRSIREAFFGLAIYSLDGTLVCALSSFDIEDGCRDLDAGLHSAVFSVPSFPVAAGRYEAFLTLNKREPGGSETLEAWHARPEFEVIRRRESLQVPPPWEGVLALPAEFDVAQPATERNDEAAGARTLNAAFTGRTRK